MSLRWLFAAALVAASAAQTNDVQTVYERRLPFIVSSSMSSAADVGPFMSLLQPDGKWAAVNYTTGCDAQRANWPAGVGHWNRTLVMAAAYHGGVSGAEQYVKNPNLRSALSKAMNYWFANDFSTIGNGACLDDGGKANGSCPCGTPGLWNTNWFSNVILVPTYVGKVCLLLRDELAPTELGNCTLMTARAYTPFYRNPQPGYVSGANIIDMASVGIAAGLLENNRTGNASRLADAYQRVHNEVVIHPQDLVDGIKPDGSFQQHIGIVYDGNYGKDLRSVGTAFQANETTRAAFGTHLDGAQWMVFADVVSKTVVGRMIAFALSDDQATANIKMNLTRVQELGDAWNSTRLQKFATDLSKTPHSANAGDLKGNRMFWNSDYMVHRADQTVTTIRMLSNRTKTSECVNTQNPFGFHLSDGAMYQYSNGGEYLDMYATFDWNLVPGTTVDYGATPLGCNTTEIVGVETFAGGVSAKDMGVAAMRYINPRTKTLSFHKAWFFFGENVQHVLVNGISSTNPAQVVSVLDQRLHKGPIYLDREPVLRGNYCEVDSLWHAGTGYVFPEEQGTKIWIEGGEKTGNWKTIGTSASSNVTKVMFSASIVHDSGDLGQPIEYSIFPATASHQEFEDKAEWAMPQTVVNDATVGAALDFSERVFGAAFWNVGGGSVRIPKMGITVYVDRPVVLMIKLTQKGNRAGEVYVADPTHGTGIVHVRLVWSTKGGKGGKGMQCKRMNVLSYARHGARRCGGHGSKEVVLEYHLPEGGMAGSGVMQGFEWSK